MEALLRDKNTQNIFNLLSGHTYICDRLPLASIVEKYINYDKVAGWRKSQESSAHRVFIFEKYPKKLKRCGRICLSVA
jgi:hypothetical protein